MKTATECGLTQGQWEALRDETGDASFSLEIEQYSLSLTSHDSDGHGSSIDNFDAIVCDDTIVRAWRSAADTISIQTLADEDGGDQSWSAAEQKSRARMPTPPRRGGRTRYGSPSHRRSTGASDFGTV